MRKRILFFIALLTCIVMAASDRNELPNPELVPEGDVYSIAVVQLRENDEPIKQLLEAAIKSISSGETKLPPSMADVSDYLSRNSRADMLFAGLPFQTVRVDRMVNGQDQGTTVVTLAGWKGLQVNVRNSLSAGPDGKAFPVTRYRVTDLVQRDVNVMCQVNGSFVFAPDADSAKKLVDRLAPKDKPVPPVASPTLTAFKALPKTSDAYGVVINQKGAFSALLKSLNNDQIQKIRDKVGNDRLEKAVANTKSATWSIDITSAERADLQAVLTCEQKDVADIAALFEEGKTSLDATKVADVVITPGPGTVTVKGAIINLKQLMLDGMVKGKV